MKNILLIATGSVAVVKFKKIKELLSKKYSVKVIVTDFVRKHYKDYPAFQAIVEDNDLDSFPLHIKHARWADLIVVAPATANTLAKFNAGIADNHVLSTLIAARNPIMFVPAMNTWMYEAIVQRNVITSLSKLGHMFVGPTVGMLREGESGLGRMVEPEEIVQNVNNYFNQEGKIILMPYGASKVRIDPIRYITNGSTGTMAKLLSNELRLKGYKVIDVDISNMTNQEFINFALKTKFDVYISPAAFADFDVNASDVKIKKNSIDSIKLKNNLDVITTIKETKFNEKYFAFKLDESRDNAIKKMESLGLDGIIWNQIDSMGATIVSGEIIMKNTSKTFNSISKHDLAKTIAEVI